MGRVRISPGPMEFEDFLPLLEHSWGALGHSWGRIGALMGPSWVCLEALLKLPYGLLRGVSGRVPSKPDEDSDLRLRVVPPNLNWDF